MIKQAPSLPYLFDTNCDLLEKIEAYCKDNLAELTAEKATDFLVDEGLPKLLKK